MTTEKLSWTLVPQPVQNSDETGLYALVNTTGADAHGVRLHADDIAAREVFRMNVSGLVIGTETVLANDEIGHIVDLGRGYPEGGHLTVEWSSHPGGPTRKLKIPLHQHHD